MVAPTTKSPSRLGAPPLAGAVKDEAPLAARAMLTWRRDSAAACVVNEAITVRAKRVLGGSRGG